MIRVADAMTPRPVAVDAAATVADAIVVMKERGISSALVLPPLASSGHGMITMHDIVARIVREGIDPVTVSVGDAASWRLITAEPAWPLRRAAEVMAAERVRRLPVVEGTALVGLLSDTDIFTALTPRHEWAHVRQARKARALARAARSGSVRTVADLMSAPALTVDPEASVQEAVAKMVAAGISSLLVSGAGPGPAGIVTKRDVVTKTVAGGRDPRRVTVRELMSHPVRTIEADATLEACSARMAAERVRRFPVIRGGEVAGIISDSDILAAVAGHRWLGRRTGPTAAIAADIMRDAPAPHTPAPAEALAPEQSVWECAAHLAQAGVRELPVVQGGRIIGVVGEVEILKALEERGGPD